MHFNKDLEITTTVPCKVNCYPNCPQPILNANYKGNPYLTLEDYITALSNCPKEVRIAFCGLSEPFLNPYAIDMMEETYKRKYRISLFTTLVGLSLEDIDRLAHIDFETITLHLPDPYGTAHIPDTEDYNKVVTSVFRKLHISAVVSMNKHFVSNYRAGLCPDQPKPIKIRTPFICSKLLRYAPVMFPDGTVTLCCMDFTFKYVLGNLFNQSYDSLFKSQVFKKAKRDQFLFSNKNTMCRSCTVPFTPRRVFSRMENSLIPMFYPPIMEM